MSQFDPESPYRQMESATTPVLHIRFEGASRDIPLDLLNIAPASSDGSVRDAVARYLDVAPEKLARYVVERHENGNMTLRPEAVFG